MFSAADNLLEQPRYIDASSSLTDVAPDISATPERGRRARIRTGAYWACTVIIVWEMAAGSMWDLLRIDYTRAVLTQLGYPHYLLLILGVWKLPCAVTLLVPRFPRLKEWAYAGAVFNYTGASASHFLAGEGAGRWVPPLVFGAITLASWWLRAPDRRVLLAAPATRLRPLAWIVPLGVVAAFAGMALLTLPS